MGQTAVSLCLIPVNSLFSDKVINGARVVGRGKGSKVCFLFGLDCRIPGHLMAIFTLEDEQIVWTDKLSQTNQSSDVQMG